MKVRIWNAYASNNSGSYTIVGLLPSEEVARELAERLREVIERHDRWVAADGDPERSPLADFCRAHGLSWAPGRGAQDDWPRYGDDNRPQVAAVGRQLIVHHPYTVTLPPTFGEAIYRAGGRVQHEEDHAHHPIAVEAHLWWGWSNEERQRMPAFRDAVLRAIVDGPLAAVRPDAWPPAWRVSDEFMESPLAVGAVFADLLAGTQALRTLAALHEAQMRVDLREAPDARHDPFAHLRPSTPAIPRFDLVVRTGGPEVARALAEALDLYESGVREQLEALPAVVGRGMVLARAEALAALARQAGAEVDLVRNDH